MWRKCPVDVMAESPNTPAIIHMAAVPPRPIRGKVSQAHKFDGQRSLSLEASIVYKMNDRPDA